MGRTIISKDPQECPLRWMEEPGTQISSSRYLLHAAALYLIIVVTLWFVPACFYHRISESGQAVVLTLVDTAASELQSLADPKIVSEFRARSLSNNLSLSSTAVRNEDKDKILETTTEPKPKVEIATEKLNDSAIDNVIPEIKETKKLEEDTESVVIVRAEKKSLVDESKIEADVKSDDEIPSKEEIIKDTDLNPDLELNDTKSQLSGGINDDSAPVALDGIAISESSDTQEDMPSFSEWAQKQLEEAEKKKTPNVSVQTPGNPGKNIGGMKMRSKNYASPDCGAKIVAANPETRSARNVLVSTRDEYMLNTCTSRIWFVVELCEAIQAKKIELANFELFSSSPKDFSVLVSDRFPTRDWSSVGHFTAKDERDIQSFPLQPQLFGKFIKIELHSHYGSEHFCPISLFRTYGTSEFEVLETETEVQNPTSDDEDLENGEEALDSEGGEATRNLFGSARDAVLSIVRKAAEVLVKTGDLSRNNITKIQESIRGDLFQNSFVSCTTPRYTIVCKNCTDDKFARVFQLLSCKHRYLTALLDTKLIKNTLPDSHLCLTHNGKFEEDSHKPGTCKARDLQATFIASVFTPDYVEALCNVLAAKDGKVLLNSSDEIAPIPDNGTLKEEIVETKEKKREILVENLQPVQTSSASSCRSTVSVQESRQRTSGTSGKEPEVTIMSSESSSSNEILSSQIKPTKTLSQEEEKKESSMPVLEPSKDQVVESSHLEILTTPSPAVNLVTPLVKIQEDSSSVQAEPTGKIESTVQVSSSSGNEQEKQEVHEKVADLKIQEAVNKSGDVKTEGHEQDVKQSKLDLGDEAKILSQEQMNFDSLLSDFKEFEGDNGQNGQSGSYSAAQPTASSMPQQKESVFLRLSNRIKALERNMSLSGQYLEELSRRYKKQVEEMQRSLERATSAMNEEFRKGEERDVKRLEEIAALREIIKSLSKSVDTLLHDRDSWQSKLYYFGEHVIFICINLILVSFVISYYRRTVDFEEEEEDKEINESTETSKVPHRKFTDFLREKTVLPKKPKKRRPSEIANNIAGTYEELMIEDQRVGVNSKKEKKKKRKKESILRISNGDSKSIKYKEVFSPLPNEGSSISKLSVNLNEKRPSSAQDNYAGWVSEKPGSKIEILSTPEEIGVSDDNSSFQNELFSSTNAYSVSSNDDETGPVKKVSKTESFRSRLSSPSFMKTALGSRSKRFSIISKESNSSLRNVAVNGSASNGFIDESDRSSSATPTPEKKEKKATGLKKMVRKFF